MRGKARSCDFAPDIVAGTRGEFFVDSGQPTVGVEGFSFATGLGRGNGDGVFVGAEDEGESGAGTGPGYFGFNIGDAGEGGGGESAFPRAEREGVAVCIPLVFPLGPRGPLLVPW